MHLNEYQKQAKKTFLMDEKSDLGLYYLTMGLTGEAGEVANKVKKVLRNDYTLEEAREKIRDELGDVLWYVAVLSSAIGYSLGTVAQHNLVKLEYQHKNNKIHGDGDDR